MSTDTLLPGFADPVSATQQVFRQALDALAEPGRPHAIAHGRRLDRLDPASYALCLTFLDSDTPLWIAPSLDTPVLRNNLAFHCACPVVEDPSQAMFSLLTLAELDRLDTFDAGSDRDPDLSCTLFIQLPSLDNGPIQNLQGPGIEHKRTVHLPLPADFWQRRSTHSFPCGLDMFFTADDRLMGLPRSTRVTHPA